VKVSGKKAFHGYEYLKRNMIIFIRRDTYAMRCIDELNIYHLYHTNPIQYTYGLIYEEKCLEMWRVGSELRRIMRSYCSMPPRNSWHSPKSYSLPSSDRYKPSVTSTTSHGNTGRIFQSLLPMYNIINVRLSTRNVVWYVLLEAPVISSLRENLWILNEVTSLRVTNANRV